MKDVKNVLPDNETVAAGVSRRRFLGYAGGLAGAGLLIASCEKENNDPVEPGAADLGTNDNGLINLMFVTQQIEADFYAKILASPYADMTEAELLLYKDMADHEIAHREFLRNYLQGKGTVVNTDFSTIDFTNKWRVLENLELIENLVVSTFNEIGRLFDAGEHVAIVAKMVSLEARHAGTISNLRTRGAYFGTIDAIGVEQGTLPSNSITTFNRFLATKVSGNNLPNK